MINEQLIWRDKSLLSKIKNHASDAVKKILPDMTTARQNEAGGIIRDVTAGTLDQFGSLATVTATQSYQDMRASAVPTAKTLKVAPTYKVADVTLESVVGYTMASFVTDPTTVADTLSMAVGYAVANDYRQAGVDLSSSDPVVSGFQRVASANACAFCALATLSTYTSWEDDAGFHDHCECTTIPVFKGQDLFAPSYYSDFADEVTQAQQDIKDFRASVEPDWRDSWQAAGGRMGKNLNRDFLKAYPDAAINTKNIVNRMRARRAS